MIIGMLWAGKDVSEAKKYYIKKYNRIPDTLEISPTFSDKIGIEGKSPSYDGLNVVRTNSIMNGCLFIGVESDEGIFNYDTVK
jgi:hypothetical protein